MLIKDNYKFILIILFSLAIIINNLILPYNLPIPGWDLPVGWDYEMYFKPAAQEALLGHNPLESVKYYFSPPWLLLFTIPLSFLPNNLSVSLLLVVSFFSFYTVAKKLGAKEYVAFLILLSPPILLSSFVGNFDWLVALGLIAPPWLGVILLLLKPQAGALVVLYLVLDIFRKEGIRGVIKTLTPLALILVISFILYSFWPAQTVNASLTAWNSSPFPTFLPIGLVLFAEAIQKNKQNLALVSTIFFSPFLHSLSFGVPLLGLLPSSINVVVGVIGLWLVEILMRVNWLGI